MGQLVTDTSPLVAVPALLSLGPFLLALPPADAAAPGPPLLAAFASSARLPPPLQAVRVPSSRGRWPGVAEAWEGRHEGDGGGEAPGAEPEVTEFRHAAVELPVACAHYLGQVGSSQFAGARSSRRRAVRRAPLRSALPAFASSPYAKVRA